MPDRHAVTMPEPRCPFCNAVLEEVQIVDRELVEHPGIYAPHEVWNCSSCNSNHIFPARIEFMKHVGASKTLQRSGRVEYLPRGRSGIVAVTKNMATDIIKEHIRVKGVR